jgi:hypothetical protein
MAWGKRRLKSKHIKLARSYKFNNDRLHKYEDAQAVMDRYIPYFEKDLGMRLVIKSTTKLKLSKMTTTYYNEIRLGSGWKDKNLESQAYILVHEAVHARQWRHYGRAKFGWKYISDPRWRWAIEVQGYREGIMWGVVVLKARGLSQAKIEKALSTKIDHVISSLLRAYSLGSIRSSDIKKHTRDILEGDIRWQYSRLT